MNRTALHRRSLELLTSTTSKFGFNSICSFHSAGPSGRLANVVGPIRGKCRGFTFLS